MLNENIGDNLASVQATKLLDCMDEDKEVPRQYTTGFAHALLLMGVIDSNRWTKVTGSNQEGTIHGT